MDTVDLVILDKMTSPDAVIFGGFDPRHEPESMAEKVGLTASSIRKRMTGWRASGFLVRWHVVPHPAHLGMQHFVGYYSAKRPADRERLCDALDGLEGALASFEQVGGLVGFGMYARDAEGARAITAPLAQLTGVSMLSGPMPVELREPLRPWTPDETTLVKQLRATPDDSPKKLSESLGIEEDVVNRTLDSIAESGGLFTLPELDFARFKGVLVRVVYDVAGADPRPAYDAIREKYDASFYRNIGSEKEACGHAMVSLRSISLLDELEGTILEIPGVTDVEFQIPRRFRILTRWLDEVTNAL